MYTEEDVKNTVIARLADVEIPEMPVDHRIPVPDIIAVLKEREGVVQSLDSGAIPSKPPLKQAKRK